MQLELCWGASQQAGAAGFDIRGPARDIEIVNCIAIGNSQEGVRIRVVRIGMVTHGCYS